MREAFREFWRVLPNMLRWWIGLGLPGVFLMLVLVSGRSVGEAAALTVAVLVGGVPLLPFIWARPAVAAQPVLVDALRLRLRMVWWSPSSLPSRSPCSLPT